MISKYDEQDGEEDEDDGGRERRLEVIYSYLKCSLLLIGIYPNLILVTTSLLLSSPLVSSPLLSSRLVSSLIADQTKGLRRRRRRSPTLTPPLLPPTSKIDV
jgi:hypothetical protein